jgi:hypothetical protein
MLKKVNIYYKNKTGKAFYLWSSNQFKTVKEAVKNAKLTFKQNPHYKKAYKGKTGEEIVSSRVYGSFK